MSESGSNSSSSTPPDTPAESAAPITDDNRSKRFDFLLKQTEVFAHFMGGQNKAKSPLKGSCILSYSHSQCFFLEGIVGKEWTRTYSTSQASRIILATQSKKGFQNPTREM